MFPPEIGHHFCSPSSYRENEQQLREQQDLAWFALQVKPRHEFVTATTLQNKGFDHFMPVYTRERQWSDRKRKITLPLFTGYVFCRFSPHAKLPIITTAGVLRIVGSSKGATPISGEEIETIRKVTLLGRKVQPCCYIPVGSKVTIEEGPKAGLKGMFKGQRIRSEMIISVDLVQQSISIDVEGYAVRMIPD